LDETQDLMKSMTLLKPDGRVNPMILFPMMMPNLVAVCQMVHPFKCSETVGWVTGRTSGL